MDKKTFYKERQKFFDAVKEARGGENPVITYNKERYRLFHVNSDNFYDYIDKVRYGYYVCFDQKRKFNVVRQWTFSSRNGFCSVSNYLRWYHLKEKHVLCFAELLNQE